jgi:hypothetical protein
LKEMIAKQWAAEYSDKLEDHLTDAEGETNVL